MFSSSTFCATKGTLLICQLNPLCRSLLSVIDRPLNKQRGHRVLLDADLRGSPQIQRHRRGFRLTADPASPIRQAQGYAAASPRRLTQTGSPAVAHSRASGLWRAGPASPIRQAQGFRLRPFESLRAMADKMAGQAGLTGPTACHWKVVMG